MTSGYRKKKSSLQEYCHIFLFVFFGLSPVLRKLVLNINSLEEKFPTTRSYSPGCQRTSTTWKLPTSLPF
jgi:hypothetical protein